QPHERLLVVDDDPDVREIVVGFLSELGYDVRVATHGGEGLKILTEFQPDAIILDFAMPGMNGAETAVSLRQEAPEIPILFRSGFSDSDVLEAVVGAAPLLRKPFRPTELASAIRSLLDRRAV